MMPLAASYDTVLVVLSILIAVLASYSALDLAGRAVGATSVARRRGWIAMAALVMGGGIWSMHFIGMLAFRTNMPATYDVGGTVLSLMIAVVATGAAFVWISRPNVRRRDVLPAGLLMGGGVAAMHYVGMAAMRMDAVVSYNGWIVALSVLIAFVASSAALMLALRTSSVTQKLAAASVMGFAVYGMHYCGMLAATFTEAGAVMGRPYPAGDVVPPQTLALYVAGATFALLFFSLLASSIDQARVQRDLMASEKRFRAAAEVVGDIIWTNDAQGQMTGEQLDWARFTGQSRAEYAGYGWAASVHPDDVAATQEAWRKAVEGRQVFVHEHRLHRHDGAWRLFAVRAVPVLDEAGRLQEWVGVHEDITDRRMAEADLLAAKDAAEEANQAKSTFLANMSHELRTPLSAIIGYSEMLQEEVADGGGAADFGADISKIESNARHLLGLINDVLDLSKVESGKMEAYAETFDAAEMVRDVASTAQGLVEKKGNVLDVRVAPDLGAMHSDVTKVRQVLLNLLSNAAKFTESGTITLSVARGPRPDGVGGQDWMTFRIGDTGIGMTEEQLGKLFQRFQQADASTTRKFGGTGLGLSITKAFSTMLGGDIEVESVSGQGSTFTVYLPTTLREPGEAAGELEETAGDSVGRDPAPEREVVLVIDDDSAQRELMTRFLAREGFGARTAPDGRTGLRMARSLRPRAILLDVMMPGMDGWSVLSALKADPELAAIPVVMVTFVSERGLAVSLGAADYVLKPVEWERFRQVMERFRKADGDVLVVDDDPDTRQRMRVMLEKSGWTVVEAGNGQDALDRVVHTIPQLILLDLTMPIMDGFMFLHALRERPGCADIPVVVLTARDLTNEERHRLRGASQILNKGNTRLRDLAGELHALAAPARLQAVLASSTQVEPVGAGLEKRQ